MKQEKVDVAIIGAGIGGMCAGALLAHAGYNVVVTEKLPQLGGRCSNLEYKGFKLFTGVACIETSGVVEEVFREVGAEFNVRMPDPQVVYRIRGKDHTMPTKGRLKTLLSLACEDEAEARRVMSALRRAMFWQEPSDSISLSDWLEQYTQNPTVKGLFYAYVSDEREIGAGEVMRNMRTVGPYLYGYPIGGCIELVESLAKVIRASGGQVWTGSPAQRILVDDWEARGIIVRREGRDIEISAGAVISNAGPQATVELAGKENFDKGHLKDAENLPCMPYIQLHVISDRPLIETPAIMLLPDAQRMYYMMCPTSTCPELAPPGKHMLLVGGSARPSLGLIDFRKELQLAVQDLRANIAEVDRYGQILHAACYSGRWPAGRSVQGRAMPRKTPVERLYEVGDGVAPSGAGGQVGCVRSAREVVADIKSRLKPSQYM